jgi:glycosyltransferase involved in cell wall biosynthesis
VISKGKNTVHSEDLMSDKITVLMIADHPFSTTGVSTQAKYIIDHLLATGRYRFVCMAGAVKHKDYRPTKTEQWGDDLVVFPVDGYGNPEILRSILQNQKPDILWFMTDPRFYTWLWDMEDEIRAQVPTVYYHVWDNLPYPRFNANFYNSTDVIVSISKLTNDIVANVAPDVRLEHIPHSVDMNIFHKKDTKSVEDMYAKLFPQDKERKKMYFWNSRNARRKMSSSLLWWYKDFVELVGDTARLVMHTDPRDPNGANLESIIAEQGLDNGEVMFSTTQVSAVDLANIYNLSHCTIGVSDAEGFGLSTLESLACQTPIIVNMTGGLQEQVTDGTNYFGIPIYPVSKAIVGTQEVPYIYEDRISKEDFLEAMLKMHNISPEEHAAMGLGGREHLLANYNPLNMMNKWDILFQDIYKQNGRWGTRGHKRWHLIDTMESQ